VCQHRDVNRTVSPEEGKAKPVEHDPASKAKKADAPKPTVKKQATALSEVRCVQLPLLKSIST